MKVHKLGPTSKTVTELNSVRRIASKIASKLEQSCGDTENVDITSRQTKSNNGNLRLLAHANSAIAVLKGRITPPLINDSPCHKS